MIYLCAATCQLTKPWRTAGISHPDSYRDFALRQIIWLDSRLFRRAKKCTLVLQTFHFLSRPRSFQKYIRRQAWTVSPIFMRTYFLKIISVLTILISSCNNAADKSDKTETSTDLILGEQIDGPANIRDTINGKVLFSLNDNTIVETTPTENDWLIAGLFVKLTPKQMGDFKILPGSNIISSDSKVVGKTLDTVDVWISHDDDSTGLIGAYTHKDNIKSKTVPEKILCEIIDNGKLNIKDLKPFITSFKFQQENLGELPGLTQYYIYESIVVDMSPRDRITLLFNKKNNLVGVIHSRNLVIKNFKTFDLIRGHKLTITSDLDPKEIKSLIDKRIEFYNSVD